ncbi:MAG: HD domain-containing protein [Muribaculaceae bacterium]|nr:HD domain-containing protein [Muribaculaceae bacterium]
MLDYNAIINQFYTPGYPDYDLLVTHSRQVAELATLLSRRYMDNHPGETMDLDFVYEAAMLHDVAIFKTNAPGIGCYGDEPYIRHGILGRQLLDEMGLPRHALVCERHTGSGISVKDIAEQNLKLPMRDMLPITLEEKVICYADKFYSKSHVHRMKTMARTIQSLAKFGPDTVERFNALIELFGPPNPS